MTAENTLRFNPKDIEKPYSQVIDLTPGGNGLLLNEEVILAASHPKGEARLHVFARKGVVVIHKQYVKNGSLWQGKVENGVRSITLRVTNKPDLSVVYIGSDYEVHYLSLSGDRRNMAFEIKSTHPLQITPLGRQRDLFSFLQGVLKNKA